MNCLQTTTAPRRQRPQCVCGAPPGWPLRSVNSRPRWGPLSPTGRRSANWALGQGLAPDRALAGGWSVADWEGNRRADATANAAAEALRVPVEVRARRAGSLCLVRIFDVSGLVESAVLEQFRAPQRRVVCERCRRPRDAAFVVCRLARPAVATRAGGARARPLGLCPSGARGPPAQWGLVLGWSRGVALRTPRCTTSS